MLGIDISSTTVKLLELSAQDGNYRVEGYSLASVLQGAVFEKGRDSHFHYPANPVRSIAGLIAITV